MDRIIRRSFILFLCMLLLYTSVFCIAVSADNATLVRIGIYENPPKIFTDENGNASGFWADTIDYIALEEGWDIEYVHGTWAQCLERLENGEIDIMPDVAYTEERGSLYDFSKETVYSSWSRVYAREGTEIQSILDLEGKNVAVLKGSVNVEGPEGIKNLVAEFDVTCTFIETDSYARVFEMLKSGEADAGVTSKDFGNRHEKDFNVMKTAVIFQPSLLYFAFPKESDLTPYFIERIDYHMKELKEDPHSVYYQSLENWLGVKSVGKPVIPGWIRWLLVGIGGLVVLLAAGSYILRSQVKSRTGKLAEEIVERKRAEDAIRDSEEKLRLTLESVTEGITITDLNGNVVDINEAAVRMHGYESKEQLIGRSAFELIAESDHDRAGENLKRTLEEEQTGNVEYTLLRKDGSEFSGELAASLIKDTSGNPLRFVAITRDITERRQMEKELQESEARFRSIVETTKEWIWMMDLDGRMTYNNPAIEEILGYNPDELIGHDTMDYMYEEDRHRIEQMLPELIAEKRGWTNLVVRWYCKDGTLRWLESNATPILDSRGQLVGYQGADRDITERRKAEEAMANEATKRRILIEQSGDGIVILDQNGEVYEANRRFAEMLGYSLEEVSELHVWDWDFQWTPDHLLGMIRSVDETGDHFETLHRRKDGTIYDVEISTNGAVYEGQKLIFCVCRDITQRKRAEESLRDSEEILRAMFESMTEGITFTDLQGNIKDVNEAALRMHGYSDKEELIGQSAFLLIAKQDHVKAEKSLKKTMERGYSGTVEYTLLTREGKEFPGELNAVLLRDKLGNPSSFVVITEDITERKEAEAALMLTQFVVDNAAINIFWVDDKGKFVYVNEQAVRALGYTRDELLGMHVWDIDPLMPQGRWQKHWKETKRKKTSLLETVHQHKDGTIFPVEVHSNYIRYGNEEYNIAFVRDITESKRAEEELRKSEQKYRQLLESLHEGIWVVDDETNTTFVNERMAEMLGYTVNEMLGESIFSFMAESQKQQGTEMYRQCKRGVKEQREFEFIRKDREPVYTVVATSPIFDDNGNFVGAIAGVQNVTERIRAERLFHDMFTSSSIAMYVAQDGKFKLVNPQFLKDTEYGQDELLGVSPDRVIFQEDRQSVRENSIAMLKGQRSSPYEYRYLTRSGQVRWASESVASINYDGQKATFGTSMDITELKKLEQEVLMSSKLASVGELASGVAHEINNPLSSVVGFSQLLMERTDVPSSIKEDLNKIYNESQRVVRIVQNLLQFSRKYKPEKSDVDIVDLITKTVDLRTYELNIENISVSIDYDDTIPSIRANYNELQQAILNIIINAEQALSEVERRGKISISIGKDETHVILTISDNGPGIKEPDLLDIFNPFFTTKSVGSGTGLGLYICHNIITGHNGTIDVESKAGKGTTFTIKLPIARDDEDIIVEKPIKEKISPMTKHKKTGAILIAEDEPIICDILSKTLSEEGHTVHTASDGKEALQKLNKRDYDIYVIDLKMPEISGMELYALLKDKSSMLTHKVIFMTGDVITANTVDFLASEGRPYLTKPFDYRELIELIQEVMEDEQG